MCKEISLFCSCLSLPMFSRQLFTVLRKPKIHSYQYTKNFLFTMSSLNSFKLACIQLHVTADKSDNLLKAKSKILEASRNGAKVIVLPVYCVKLFEFFFF